MSKKPHTGRTAFDLVRIVRPTPGCSLGNGIRQLTRASEPDNRRDDRLVHLGNLLYCFTTGIIFLDGKDRNMVFQTTPFFVSVRNLMV